MSTTILLRTNSDIEAFQTIDGFGGMHIGGSWTIFAVYIQDMSGNTLEDLEGANKPGEVTDMILCSM
jgi:hypothetical protein